ncbi:BCCT family transporter [Candidatus Leptofilum sp.]|uniref:BCCT family transporter n=1 Tax=Candidatus Leptofilum sp. TaxID=3241576 RepID=UPI003B5AB65A
MTAVTENMKKENRTKQRKLIEERLRQEELERLKAIEERDQFYGLQVDPEVEYYEEIAHREPGDTNWVGYGFDLHPQVTLVAGGLLLVFVAWTLLAGEQAASVFSSLLTGISTNFGWLYIAAANIFVIAMAFFAFSKYGKIRIGGPEAKPEFSNFAWYSMLISAGMGIGLMFWSVAEPIFHFSSPSPMFGVEAGGAEAAQAAFAVTYFHWGLHPWGIYALVSLGLAFFAYNRGLPLTIRSVFYPILGDRIYGWWGNIIDILSVIATLFGLATSLGFGVQQVSAGLNFLFGLPTETWFQVLLIVIITGFATMSVVAGLDGGVKKLSEWNIRIAGLLLLFVLILGPTVYILSSFFQNVGFYIQRLPQLALWTETYQVGDKWQAGWTVFYWGWWISWSPFVGMFIARVSKGRMIKEFIVGVMLLPTLLSFFWMSVFGGTAIFNEQTGVDISRAVNENVATAMFEMFQNLPLTGIISFVGIVLVVFFFVTSSDSGSLVVDHLTSGGKLDSPVPQRVFWAIMEGLLAAVLLLGGGLAALQTASIAAGLPFTIVLLIMIYSLRKGLHEELYHLDAHEIKEVIERTPIDVETLEGGLSATGD